jgi:hypothetical protein
MFVLFYSLHLVGYITHIHDIIKIIRENYKRIT